MLDVTPSSNGWRPYPSWAHGVGGAFTFALVWTSLQWFMGDLSPLHAIGSGLAGGAAWFGAAALVGWVRYGKP